MGSIIFALKISCLKAGEVSAFTKMVKIILPSDGC